MLTAPPHHESTAVSSSHTSPAEHMFRMRFTVIIQDSHIQTVTSPFSLINPIDIHYR